MSLVEKLNYRTLTFIVITVIVLYVITAFFMMVYGESEDTCIRFSSNHLKIIGKIDIQYITSTSGCEWLVDKLLYNGSGFHVSGYQLGGDQHQSYQIFVMTR